jgi:hypothetical protein
MSAYLRTVANAPLPGRKLNFTIGDRFVCSANTDSKGLASCGGYLDGISTLLNLGYRAAFAGGPDHSASAATGPLVSVYTVRV